MRNQALTIKPRRLTVEDVQESIKNIPGAVIGGQLVIDKSLRGWPLKNSVTVELEKVLSVGEKGLIPYIIQAFVSERPALIPFVFSNRSLVRLSRHFLRGCSGSPMTLYSYVDTISRYSRFVDFSPDVIINDVKSGGNVVDIIKQENHKAVVETYLANIQDQGLSPGRINDEIKHIRTFYRVNDVEIKLTERLKRKAIYKDRAPTPEELLRLLEIADLRGMTIVSMLALGGFREGTFARLEYRHVRDDIEADRTPIHIHVEAELTKGKYDDYDTFIDGEAAQYLRSYFEQRKKGTLALEGECPPEEFSDESPLIRQERTLLPNSITPKQIRRIVHRLYLKAGLIKKPKGRMYELRTHSLRKFFKTQLIALGVQSDYVEYMMGHKVDTYHDIQSLGIEKLRNVYATAHLRIRPRAAANKIEMLKEIIRAQGLNPEQILNKEALTQGATTYLNPEERETQQLQVLYGELKGLIQQEISKNSTKEPE